MRMFMIDLFIKTGLETFYFTGAIILVGLLLRGFGNSVQPQLSEKFGTQCHHGHWG